MRTYIFAVLSIVFCASCSSDPHEALVVPEIFGAVQVEGKPADNVSVSIGRASDESCSDLPGIATTDAHGTFHVSPKIEQRLSRDAIFGDRIGLKFSVCFSTSNGNIYGGDFVVKTWLTKSIRIECRYPEMVGSDFTGKSAYCKQVHA